MSAGVWAGLARSLAIGWVGVMVAIAWIVAPQAFEQLARAEAGRLMGRIFAIEAGASCAVIVLALVAWRQARARVSEAGSAGGLDGPVLLLAGALFCTVAGYYGLQPLMAQARAGQGSVGFGTLHAVSGVFFTAKAALLAAAGWRLHRLPRPSA